MLNLLLNELKQISKMRRIKSYENMSKKRLLSALNELELVESEKNIDNAITKKIRENFKKLREVFKTRKKRE